MTFPDFLTVIDLKECKSTNTYLKENFSALSNYLPVLVMAETQTQGRGRQDRDWISKKNLGLTSSFGFFLPDSKRLNFLPLIAGICVIELLNDLIGEKFVLKWPNDVLYQNKKTAGILIENSLYQGRVFSITGMGINVNHRIGDFSGFLAEKAISLKLITGNSYSIKELNIKLAQKLFYWLEKLNRQEEGKIIEKCRDYSSDFYGRSISFHLNDQIINGKFVDIADDGGLILHIAGQQKIFYTGEIF